METMAHSLFKSRPPLADYIGPVKWIIVAEQVILQQEVPSRHTLLFGPSRLVGKAQGHQVKNCNTIQFFSFEIIWTSPKDNHNDSRWYSLAQCRLRNCWRYYTFLFKMCNYIVYLLIRPKMSCKIDMKKIFDYEISYMRSITAVKVPDRKFLFLWLIHIKTIKHSLHF